MVRGFLARQHKGTVPWKALPANSIPLQSHLCDSFPSPSFSVSLFYEPCHVSVSETGVSWAVATGKVPSPLRQIELVVPENRIWILRPLSSSFDDKQYSASMKGNLQRLMEIRNPNLTLDIPSPSATSCSFSPETQWLVTACHLDSTFQLLTMILLIVSKLVSNIKIQMWR